MPETVLITGTARGLGLSLSKIMLKNGNSIIAVNIEKTSEFSVLSRKYKDRVIELYADVSRESSVKRASMRLGKITDSIDILINNAGIHPEPSAHEWKHIDDLSDVSIRKLVSSMAVNSFGPLTVVKHFLHFLKKGGKKLIINISSEAGSISSSSRKDEFGYCMSKAALNMQSKILRNRLSEFGIKVIAIHPGWMKTGMGGAGAPDQADESAEKIITLAGKNWDLNDPIYMDTSGKTLEW